jgi:uncharacterized protein involved in exopolysaccharide biosynthesis
MTNHTNPKDDDSIDYLGVIIARWWLVLLGTLICGGAAAGISLLLPDVYEASVVLIVAPPQFKTELKPSAFPAQTYKRMVESKGLAQLVLQKMKERHPADFQETIVEDLLQSSTVEAEVTKGQDAEIESPLLVLSVRHERPEYAKEIADTWADEFMELNKRLQKTRTEETDKFISEQFQEARSKLIKAEKDVTDFNDQAQVEALIQQAETVSEQAKTFFTQLEKEREDLALEKRKLAALEERIAAVELEGRWLGKGGGEDLDMSEMSEVQRELASELIRVAKRHEEATTGLAELTRTIDTETMRQRLSSLRKTVINESCKLREVQSKRKSVESALSTLSSELAATEAILILKKALPEEVLWENVLQASKKEEVKQLSEMYLASEILNPNYTLLSKQVITLKQELEMVSSEEKYLTQAIPKLEEEIRNLESQLQIQQKKYSDLTTFRREAQRQYESRYCDYMLWLDERNTRRISAGELELSISLLEKQHSESLSRMRSMSTDLKQKQDRLEQLNRAVEIAKHAYELFQNKVEESRIAKAQETEEVRLVSSAITPGKKVAPQRSLTTGIGGLIGILLSVLGALLLEYRTRFLGRK